jgi:hypothetical protein
MKVATFLGLVISILLPIAMMIVVISLVASVA